MAERYAKERAAKVDLNTYKAPKGLVILAQWIFLLTGLLAISAYIWFIIVIWDNILELI